jgi:hypothetical protein
MRRFIIGAAAVAALAVPATSFAAAIPNNNSNLTPAASQCGLDHGARASEYGSNGFLGSLGGAHGYTGQVKNATGQYNSQTVC